MRRIRCLAYKWFYGLGRSLRNFEKRLMIYLSREIGSGSIFVLVYTVFEHTLSSSFFSENEISKRKTSEQVRKKGKDKTPGFRV